MKYKNLKKFETCIRGLSPVGSSQLRIALGWVKQVTAQPGPIGGRFCSGIVEFREGMGLQISNWHRIRTGLGFGCPNMPCLASHMTNLRI